MEHIQDILPIKIIVVGDIGTGKTSYIKRYVDGIYSKTYKSTIGVDFYHKKMVLDGISVSLQLWDMAGQERYGSTTQNYYRGSQGALVFCDVSRKCTWDGMKKWKIDIDNKVKDINDNPIPTILVISKIDLYNENDTDNFYNRNEIDNFCKNHGFIGHIEISTLNNKNIDVPLMTLVKGAIENFQSIPVNDSSEPFIKINNNPHGVGKGGCC